jgi:hypothetical protein
MSAASQRGQDPIAALAKFKSVGERKHILDEGYRRAEVPEAV